MEKLVNLSDSIKLTAESLLKQTKLINLLEKFATVKITGSYSANIMYNKDIDIYLIKGGGFTIDEVLEIHNTIFRKKIVNGNILLGNNKDMQNLNSNFPLGYYLGLKFKITISKSVEKWKVDIWCIDSVEYNKIKYKDLPDKINDELREILLQIKQYVSDNELDIPSVVIYDSVFEKYIRSLEAFKKSL